MKKNKQKTPSITPLVADFISSSAYYRRNFGGGIRQDIARAVGIKSGIRPDVIDATAGLGRDSFILASLGSKITLIERSQIIHDLLADGMKRASRIGGRTAEIISRMKLLHADAIEILPKLSTDVIYLDPMHPPRKKSALVKAKMRQIRSIVGEDPDQIELITTALNSSCNRVTLKWPFKSPLPSLLPKSSYQIMGKTVQFDIFIKSKLKKISNREN